jgi:hypothetical protein
MVNQNAFGVTINGSGNIVVHNIITNEMKNGMKNNSNKRGEICSTW